MARIRTIKPQFFLSEELSDLPAMVRLLFIGLWTQADREGRLLDRPKRLKAEIFPYENFDIEKGLNQLQEAGFILRYKVNVNVTDSVLAPEQPIKELALIQVINFLKHQKIDKANEKESEYQPPTSVDIEKTINSLPIGEEGKGREGKGKELFLVDSPEKENFMNFQKWILENAGNVMKMKEPFSFDNFSALKKRFSSDYIKAMILKMHNYKPLLQKNNSAYLTFLNWAEKDSNAPKPPLTNDYDPEQKSREILEQSNRPVASAG